MQVAMRLQISRAHYAELLALAAASPDTEVCGLVFGDHCRVEMVMPVTNVAADPARQFEIDPAALINALRCEREGGRKLLGYFHSHPQGPARPSSMDRERAIGDGRLWLIIGNRQITAWRIVARTFEQIAIEIGGDAPERD
ncbi:MAG: M67 family metallopeptidase [Sphingomonadaceae bacterium]